MASPKGLGSNESIGSVAVSPEQLLCARRHFEPFYGQYRAISSGAIDCRRQMKSIMATDPSDPFEMGLEAERAYWRSRLTDLEILLCELLVENERLRQERRRSTFAQFDQGTALTNF